MEQSHQSKQPNQILNQFLIQRQDLLTKWMREKFPKITSFKSSMKAIIDL